MGPTWGIGTCGRFRGPDPILSGLAFGPFCASKLAKTASIYEIKTGAGGRRDGRLARQACTNLNVLRVSVSLRGNDWQLREYQ